MRITHWISCAILVAGVALLGCSRKVVVKGGEPDVVVAEKQRPGPPDHAPAHGYRKKHGGDNVILVYDSKLKVYAVDNHRDCYYSAGQYFRIDGSSWQFSVSIDGPWRVVKIDSDLPPGLRKMDVSANNKKKVKDKGKKK
ncbi:MAG TPA: hypothetical protein VFT13_09220 [Candidatus Krumholzibacteria bacterium]|nr:hypothetical protein [Candidatus Krumholzibacteria bacterium]